MSAASSSTGLAAYLKTVTAVTAVTGGRVYRPQLDPDEDASMPQAAVVVRTAGGYQLFGGGNVPMGDPRLDVFCYGSTWLEAESVAETIVGALRALTTSVHAGVRLYWARIAGGPMPFEDPQTNWPCVVVSAQVALTEIALA